MNPSVMEKLFLNLKLYKKRLSTSNSDGFTLVELAIYMGLLMIVIVVLTEIFTMILESQLTTENDANVSNDGRFIYTRFIYDVNRADSILTPSSLGSSSAALELTIDGEDYSYLLDNDNLIASNSSGFYQLNGYGTTISDLQFTKIGNASGKPTVRINFTVTGNIDRNGRIETKEFQTTAGLR